MIMSSTATDSSCTSKPTTAVVNLLDLAATALAATVEASRPIRDLSVSGETDKQHARLKLDGTIVTDADFASQGIICRALRRSSPDIRIVGEESEQELERHQSKGGGMKEEQSLEDQILYETAHDEIYMRRRQCMTTPPPLAQSTSTATTTTSERAAAQPLESDESSSQEEDFLVDPARVSVFVDPLDGTNAYAHGHHNVVSVLIAIILDNTPMFGVICKPFGKEGQASILNTGCVAVYGGKLLRGVYVAGGGQCIGRTVKTPENVPKAIISPPSRSMGMVRDFVDHLATQGLVHSEPIHASGAGEKSMRLVLSAENEGLWFWPKRGTSRWDVAASDALLRAMGGRLTDKFGKDLDYSTSRTDAENEDGIIASNDNVLHAECLRLFTEGKWDDRQP